MSGGKSYFKSASECVAALRQITSSSQLLSSGSDKHVYSDLLSECVTFVPLMTASDLNVFSKSVAIMTKKFHPLNVNNSLYKSIDSRISNLLQDPGVRHSLLGTFNNLSQIARWPPAVRHETLWRFSKLDSWNVSKDLDAMDRCQILSVLSRLNMQPPPLLLEQSGDLASCLKLSDHRIKVKGRICGALLALAKLGHSRSEVFDMLIELIPSRLEELDARELSNLFYALSFPAILHEDIFKWTELASFIVNKLERTLTSSSAGNSLSESCMNQIGVGSFGFASSPFFNEIFKTDSSRRFSEYAVRRVQEEKGSNHITTSKAQKVIKESLAKLGIEDMFTEEFALGPYRIDLASLPLSLLIEINGPFHYYNNTFSNARHTLQLTAKSEFKRKVLHKLGFNVLEIGYMELKDHRDRVKLIDEKLRAVLGIQHNPHSRLKNELGKLIIS